MSEIAADLVAATAARGLTLGAAESLTGGRVAAAVTGVPGASAVFAGSVVAYATEVKMAVLGVPAELVAAHGVVSQRCAEAMAEGARRVLSVDVAVATTGVAGPSEQEGKPVGTVHVAVATPQRTVARALALEGDREQVQGATVQAVLGLALAVLRGEDLPVG